jgi:hypothetical protein
MCFEIMLGLKGHMDKNLMEFQWVARGLRALSKEGKEAFERCQHGGEL